MLITDSCGIEGRTLRDVLFQCLQGLLDRKLGRILLSDRNFDHDYYFAVTWKLLDVIVCVRRRQTVCPIRRTLRGRAAR